jgi:hypothetical protein
LLAVLSALHAADLQDFVVSANTGGLSRALVAALTCHVNVLKRDEATSRAVGTYCGRCRLRRCSTSFFRCSVGSSVAVASRRQPISFGRMTIVWRLGTRNKHVSRRVATLDVDP